MMWPLALMVICPCLVIVVLICVVASRPDAAPDISQALRALAEPLDVIRPGRNRAGSVGREDRSQPPIEGAGDDAKTLPLSSL